MQETGLTAVAKYAARGKQYMVVVRPHADGLVLEQLYYAEELKSFDDVPIGESVVKDEELQLAVQLIRQAASEAFQPDAYQDEVRKRMIEQIERKIAGQEITAQPAEEPKTQIIDLMAALKASLAEGTAPEAGEAEEREAG